MPRFEPPLSDSTRPFWDATRDKRLLLQWCRSCELPVHYPREACPRCLGFELEYRPASGRGDIHAWCVMHRPASPLMADRVPYVVALVDLEEGVRMMTNIVECDPERVEVGMPVHVTWEALSDGRHLPVFAPSEAQS